MSMSGKTKLHTIYGPFTGKPEVLLDLLALLRASSSKIFFKRLESFNKIKYTLSPSTLVLSHKSSPSNSMSYQGILTDYYLLSRGNEKQQVVWNNIASYLEIIATRWPIRRFTSILNSLESIVSQMEYKNLRFKKSADRSNALSQFAIKEEAAGKVRVFALIDSISQSVMRPLHDYLFDILRIIPNDGTFDQEASVNRSIEKARASNCAFSFDLSAATDRLPRQLTGAILEDLVEVPGFSER